MNQVGNPKKIVVLSWHLAHFFTVSDQCPFRVEYLDDDETPKAAAATRRKRLKSSTESEPTYMKLSREELDSLETPKGSSSLSFRVLPIGPWNKMRQYRNFIGM